MEIFVGAWGWKHASWENDVFYPDDLPADWRLSYYSNEFELAVIPADYWSRAETDEEDWLDDVGDDFEFYLQWPLTGFDEQDLQKCRRFIDAAGEQIVSVLVDQQQWLTASETQRQTLVELSRRVAVRYFNSDDEQMSLACDDSNLEKNSGLLLLRSDDNESLRDLTARLQRIMTNTKLSRIILLPSREATEPSIERLKELATLVKLLVA